MRKWILAGMLATATIAGAYVHAGVGGYYSSRGGKTNFLVIYKRRSIPHGYSVYHDIARHHPGCYPPRDIEQERERYRRGKKVFGEDAARAAFREVAEECGINYRIGGVMEINRKRYDVDYLVENSIGIIFGDEEEKRIYFPDNSEASYDELEAFWVLGKPIEVTIPENIVFINPQYYREKYGRHAKEALMYYLKNELPCYVDVKVEGGKVIAEQVEQVPEPEEKKEIKKVPEPEEIIKIKEVALGYEERIKDSRQMVYEAGRILQQVLPEGYQHNRGRRFKDGKNHDIVITNPDGRQILAYEFPDNAFAGTCEHADVKCVRDLNVEDFFNAIVGALDEKNIIDKNDIKLKR